MPKKSKNRSLSEGFELLKELEVAKNKISNEYVVKKSNEIILVSNEILDKVERKPELADSIRRFLNYYLPIDTLFSHTAMDVATDVDVLESMLKKEGLLDDEMATILNKKEIR